MTASRLYTGWGSTVRGAFNLASNLALNDDNKELKGQSDASPNWLSYVQTGLDLVGMTEIPIVSQVADLSSGAISFYKGDYFGAGTALLAAVPLAGTMVSIYKMSRHRKTIKKTIDCLTCFSGGTLVLTSKGAKTIEDVDIGDMVWAYDEKTGDIALKEVLVTHNLIRDSLYDVHLSNGDLVEATPNHPFFVHGTWFQVKDLNIGDTLTTYAKNDGIIIIDSLSLRKGKFMVYNFTVADYHTYYVGQGEVLVHNCGGKRTPPQLPNKTLAEGDGVTIEHYYRSNDHAPAHAHVVGPPPTT